MWGNDRGVIRQTAGFHGAFWQPPDMVQQKANVEEANRSVYTAGAALACDGLLRTGRRVLKGVVLLSIKSGNEKTMEIRDLEAHGGRSTLHSYELAIRKFNVCEALLTKVLHLYSSPSLRNTTSLLRGACRIRRILRWEYGASPAAAAWGFGCDCERCARRREGGKGSAKKNEVEGGGDKSDRRIWTIGELVD